MSYSTAVAALKTTVAAVTGIKLVKNGRPLVTDALPLVYLEADNGDRNIAGQIVANTYRIRIGLVVSRQGQTLAEDEIGPFINSLPAAIDQNPTLSGAVNFARVTSWITSYPDWTEKESRSIEFVCEVLEKGSYRGSL